MDIIYYEIFHSDPSLEQVMDKLRLVSYLWKQIMGLPATS